MTTRRRIARQPIRRRPTRRLGKGRRAAILVLFMVLAGVIAVTGVIFPWSESVLTVTTGGRISFSANVVLAANIGEAGRDAEGYMEPSIGEVVSMRTADSKTYYLGNGRYRWEKYSGSVHYEEDGEWLEVDSNIQVSPKPNWDWEVTEGHWTLLINNDTSIAIGKDGYWVGYRFEGVGYFRPGTQDYEILFTRQSMAPVVAGNSIKWNNIVPGVDIEYIYDPDGFKENIYVSQSARTWLENHPPSDYGIPNSEAYLGSYFECDWSNAAAAYVKDTAINWDDAQDIDGTIYWKVTDKIVHFMPVGVTTVDDIFVAPVDIKHRFFKANGKQWLLTGSKVTELNALPIGTITFDPTTYTNQAACKDTHIAVASPTTNYGSGAALGLQAYKLANGRYRGLFEFDITDFPGGVIDTATFSVYYFDDYVHDSGGQQVNCYRALRTDWVELQATWNIYKTGSNWGTAGCSNAATDYTVTDVAIANIPASLGNWLSFDVKNQVETAIESVGSIVEFKLQFNNEITDPFNYVPIFHSAEYVGDETKRPKLVIEYTPECSEDITNTPSSHDFGNVSTSSTHNTTINKFTIVNNSGGAIDITISAGNMTGGIQWTLSDTATPGANIYGLKAGLDDEDDTFDVIVKATNANTLVSGLADEGTADWGLQLLAPTVFSDGVEKTGTVTLTATCN